MARVPIIAPREVAQTPSAPLQSGRSAQNVGNALRSVAQGFGDLADGADQYLDNRAALEAQKVISQARLEWTQTLIRRQEEAPADAPEFTQAFARDFAEYQNTTVGNVSQRAKERVQLGLMQLSETLIPKAQVFEATRRAAWRGDQIQESIRMDANALMASPDQFGAVLGSMEQSIRDQGLPADTEAALLRSSRSTFAESALMGLLRANPVATLRSLDSGRWDEYLDPDAKLRVTNAAEPAAGRAYARQAAAGAQVSSAVYAAGISGDYEAQADLLMPQLVTVESAGDPNAVSPKGAAGLAQLMPGTARQEAQEVGITALDGKTDAQVEAWILANPEKGLMLGRRYLAKQLQEFDGDVYLALAAYNAGPGMVKDWINGTNKTRKNPRGLRLGDPRTGEVTSEQWRAAIPFAETRDYIPNVLGANAARMAVGALPDNRMGRAARAEQGRIEAEQSRADQQYLQGLDDELAFLRAGNDPPGDSPFTRERLFGNLSNPMVAQQVHDQRQRAMRDGEIFAGIATATPQEIEAQRARMAAATDSPAGFRDNADRLRVFDESLARRQQQLQDDPAAYVASNVQEARDRMDAEDFDPRLYSLTQVNSQRRLGVPDGAIRVLSKGQASEMVARVNQMPVNEVGAYLRGLEQEWGAGWSSVLMGLSEAGLSDPYRFAALFASQPALSQQIVAAANQGDELMKGLSQDRQTAIKDEVNALRDQVAPYRQAFEYAGVSGAGEFNALVGTMELWLQDRMRAGAAQGADKAVELFLERNYLSPDDLPSKVMALIPRRVGGASVTEAALEFSVDAAMTDAALREFDPAPFGTDTAAAAAGGPAGTLAGTIADAQANGIWTTNAEGDGLTLMVPDAERDIMVPLEDARGRPYEILFQDMRAPARAPVNRSSRREGRDGDPIDQELPGNRAIREREERDAAEIEREADRARRDAEARRRGPQ